MNFPKPRYLSVGDLANLLLAWEAGEVSEGRMVELTGWDRVTLRDLKQSAIEQGVALAMRTPEEMAEIQAWVESQWRRSQGLPATSAPEAAGESTTDQGASFAPCPEADTR